MLYDDKKKQHVVPRSYLKHFTNDIGRIYAYNIDSNLLSQKLPSEVCVHNYSYESKEKVDNKLENILTKLESLFIPSIDYLIEAIANDGKCKLCSYHRENIYKYIILQFLRSNTGRIYFMRAFLFHLDDVKHPYSTKDVKNTDFLLRLFNYKFKKDNELENLLNIFFEKDNPEIKILVSKRGNFLTSDNPVTQFYYPDFSDECNFQALKTILPISPKICIYFYGLNRANVFFKCSEGVPEICDYRTVSYYNRALINVANHWVISSAPFDIENNIYLTRKYKENQSRYCKTHYFLGKWF